MYEIRDYFSNIENFILNSPVLEAFNAVLSMSPNEVLQKASIIIGLSYQGSVEVDHKQEINGDTNITRHEVFHIELTLGEASLADYRDIYRFIDNFQQWIDYTHFHGGTAEIIKGDNAKIWTDSDLEQTGHSGHMIRLHVISTESYSK